MAEVEGKPEGGAVSGITGRLFRVTKTGRRRFISAAAGKRKVQAAFSRNSFCPRRNLLAIVSAGIAPENNP